MGFIRRVDAALVARLTGAWCVLFAVVHFYWAAGGEAGMGGEPAETTGAQLYIAMIAGLGLVGARVAAGFWRDPILPAEVILARVGGSVLLVGVGVGCARWLADGSLNGDGAAGVATTLYFLLGGALFALLGWRTPSLRFPRAR
jgi:hypothetical protein